VLGHGFLEKVYQNAMMIELKNRGLEAEAQRKIPVFYKGKEVGEYYADIIVNELIIIEIKAGEYLHEAHERQLLNYLTATNIEVGLLMNFGIEAKFTRKAMRNKRNQNPKNQ
jgi:GxxExxY protein